MSRDSDSYSTKADSTAKDSLDAKLDTKHIEVAESTPGSDPNGLATSVADIPITWFVWLVAFTASIAGMLFGYDTGIISGVLVVLHDDLNGRPTSSSEQEMITSLCSGGAFIGAIFAGNTADRWGRKMAIYLGCVLFVVGSVLQAAAYTIAQMAVGRVVVGLGVGSAAMVVPLYIAEIAPARARGRLIGLNNMSITGGQVISYAVGAAFNNVNHGWRYMVGLGAVPAIILAVLMPFCPESPRHLVYHGRFEESRAVLRRVYGTSATEAQIDAQIDSIRIACDEARELAETGSGWSKIVQLHTVPRNLRALISACGLMVISQMSGFNALMYYSSTLFALVGFDNSTAVGLVVAGTNFIMTGVNMFVVDTMGRRRLLLSTVWGMSVGLVAVAVAFHFIPLDMETMQPIGSGVGPAAIVVLVFIIWFVIFYGVSVGNTAWMSTDFFALEVRAMGTMWMTCSNWGSNVIVSSTFLSMAKAMTPSGAFGFYAAICGIAYVWIYFFYPEVSGLLLEEVQEVFEHGFGVKYARQLRKERKDIIEERLKSADRPVPMGH
ncbi:general substrate transporter [Aspergillus aculeatinus CBS 121060]|uniref:General substrate transporter n=1 Tax=Aspergillus aculeatinus CBS 121060 TaxID=1448322 RepID=A0ACD1HDX8_9EURO|nr:general substrate transporter [Aspergillus aculeatinus CBS 121060]RAH71870.1 general substrate transporter [Aspergillus aculeatinus CBS 121060]